VYKDNEIVTQWDVFISTTATREEIESYFIFVENECKVICTKLATGDLLSRDDFQQLISENESGPVELASLMAICDDDDAGPVVTNDDEKISVAKRKDLNDTYIKVSKRKIDDLLNWISELIILQAQLNTTSSQINASALTEVTEQLEMVTNRLRDTSLEIGLVPIETLVTKFKRLVRDLSKGLGKKVNFLSEGAETEMDKDVIELMSEPIIHIIRNCIDHGIESPEVRRSSGKAEHGTVKLKAFNSSSFVNIVISDDGSGIDKNRVRAKAIENGVIAAEAELSDEEILALIFHPGLSTASKITDVSGRGVGMDVVRQKIHDLRGYVTVNSTPGKGTSIHIKLPLSRSIIDGLLVKVDDTAYVIPLNVINRIDRLAHDHTQEKNTINRSVIVNEELLSVFSLREKFHNDSVP